MLLSATLCKLIQLICVSLFAFAESFQAQLARCRELEIVIERNFCRGSSLQRESRNNVQLRRDNETRSVQSKPIERSFAYAHYRFSHGFDMNLTRLARVFRAEECSLIVPTYSAITASYATLQLFPLPFEKFVINEMLGSRIFRDIMRDVMYQKGTVKYL